MSQSIILLFHQVVAHVAGRSRQERLAFHLISASPALCSNLRTHPSRLVAEGAFDALSDLLKPGGPPGASCNGLPTSSSAFQRYETCYKYSAHFRPLVVIQSIHHPAKLFFLDLVHTPWRITDMAIFPRQGRTSFIADCQLEEARCHHRQPGRAKKKEGVAEAGQGGGRHYR